MNRYTLTYFDIRGRAEPIRLLLALAEVPYTDRGVDEDTWNAMKPNSPLGQLPFFIEHRDDGDRTTPQTLAILRHLARVHGLDGRTEDERLAADVACETAVDLRNAFSALRWGPSWHDDEAKAKYASETVPVHLARLTRLLGDREWFAAATPTYADIYAFDVMDRHRTTWVDILEPHPTLLAFCRRVEAIPALTSYLATRRPA